MITSNELENRGPVGGEKLKRDLATMKGKAKTEADADLASRLEAARAVKPSPDAHCGHCFANGRDAAIRSIEGNS